MGFVVGRHLQDDSVCWIPLEHSTHSIRLPPALQAERCAGPDESTELLAVLARYEWSTALVAVESYPDLGPGRATKRCVKSSSTASACRIPSFSITTKLRQSTKLYCLS